MSHSNSHIKNIFSETESPQPDKLLAYVNDGLSGKETREVETALINDNFLSDAHDGIEMVGTEDFSEMLSEINTSVAAKVKKSTSKGGIEIPLVPAASSQRRKSARFKYFQIAASILFLVVSGFFLVNYISTNSGVLNYYEGVLVSAEMAGSDLTDYDRAGKLFNDGKFDQAVVIFNDLPGSSAMLMAGHSYFGMEKYNEAIECFRKVLAFNDGNEMDGEFNLALAMIENNQLESGKDILKKIRNNNRHVFHQQAKKVMNAID